ncbi:hypothetical protein Ndes2437B_g00586 [Nannochloris sp. 'desiccata']
MNSARTRVGRLKETLNLDNLMLNEMANFDSNDSPLQLMSPIIGQNKFLNTKDLEETVDEPKIKAVGNQNANHQDATQLAEEEKDELAPLPALKNKTKPDPRRQSTAIFSMFEATTSGNGLLGDSELAIGDEDMELLIPLAKSNATLASKGINNLWVDPDTDDAMLEEILPEPSLTELQAVASAAATAAPSPRKKGTPRHSKMRIGVRDSAAMFAGFSLACDNSPGIDTEIEDDFLSPRKENKRLSETCKASTKIFEEKKQEPKVAVVAPVRKPSRLKPPSSSSSFFSHKTTAAAVGKSVTEAAPVGVARPPAVQPNKQHEPAPKSTSTIVKTAPTKFVKKVESIPENEIPEQPKPQPRKLLASRLPAGPLQKSRLPRPGPPATRAAPVAKQAGEPQRKAPVATKPQSPTASVAAAKTPGAVTKAIAAKRVMVASSLSSSPADDTPRTAHLRWLEAHPELAFGGGPKIANSPEAEEVTKKKSAEEMHYESWGSSLTYALNDPK